MSNDDKVTTVGYSQLKAFLGEEGWTAFKAFKAARLRVGQAFMLALPAEKATLLTATAYDPFYEVSWDSVYRAVDYLLELERRGPDVMWYCNTSTCRVLIFFGSDSEDNMPRCPLCNLLADEKVDSDDAVGV